MKHEVKKKNDCSLFETLFKIKKNGVFLFGLSFFVLEIPTYLYYANEKSDDVINCFTKTLNTESRISLENVLKTWHQKCASQKKKIQPVVPLSRQRSCH